MSDFETKDSGERAQFESGMQRDIQDGKPRFDLTWPLDVPYEEQLLVRFAELMGRGAEKYTERNWEQASGEEELARFKASAWRHFMQWYGGDRSEDHAVAIFFNVMGWEATAYKMGLLEPEPEVEPKPTSSVEIHINTPEPIVSHILPTPPPQPPSVQNCRSITKPVFESFSVKDGSGDWWWFDVEADAWILEPHGSPSSHYRGLDAVVEIIETHGVKKKSKPIAKPNLGDAMRPLIATGSCRGDTEAFIQRTECARIADQEAQRRTQIMMTRAMNGGRLIQ